MGLLWGAGFTLIRDVLQFMTMIILVRLLSPEIYGQQALAQTIVGFIAVASLKTLSQYPLQARDPATFDWDTHFSVGAAINIGVFLFTVLVGLTLTLFGDSLRTIGLVVLAMSPVFIVEIASTHQLSWLQAHHRWRRLRLLSLAGSLMAAMMGIVLAWVGAGVYALVVMTIFFGVPLAADLIFFSSQRPRFAISSLKRYSDGVRFGLNRAASSFAASGRAFAESSLLASLLGFAALGSFNRALGLAQITSGRIGPVAVQTLYPVLTRAEVATDRFRRFATLLFQGVLWLSAPAAAFLVMESAGIVRLLYGHRWESVIPLLALTGAVMAIRGMSATLNQTMLANMQTTACMRVDLAAVVLGLAALSVVIPFGLIFYLVALLACELVVLVANIVLGARGGAISPRALASVSLPCLVATGAATFLIAVLPSIHADASWQSLALNLSAHGILFVSAYLAVLWILAPTATGALLDMLPLPEKVRVGMTFLGLPPKSASGEARQPR